MIWVVWGGNWEESAYDAWYVLRPVAVFSSEEEAKKFKTEPWLDLYIKSQEFGKLVKPERDEDGEYR